MLETVESLPAEFFPTLDEFHRAKPLVKENGVAANIAQTSIQLGGFDRALNQYNNILAPNKSRFHDDETVSVLGYASLHNKKTPSEAIETYEITKRALKEKSGCLMALLNVDTGIAGDLAALAMSNNNDVQRVVELFKSINYDKSVNRPFSTNEAAVTLTSAALISDRTKAIQAFTNIVKGAKFDNDQTPAILVLSTISSGKDESDVIKLFNDFGESQVAVSANISKLSAKARAVLTLAQVVGEYSQEEIVNLYKNFKKQNGIDDNIAVRLTLALAANKANASLTCREISGIYPVARVLIPYANITTLLLEKPSFPVAA